jgi:hypothetical protein
MTNLVDYMELAPENIDGGAGINTKLIFGENSQIGGSTNVGGGSNVGDDLYIPFGLYCKKPVQNHMPKQTYSKNWLDESMFAKLFDAVSVGSQNKTHRAPSTTANKTKRRE